MIIKKLIEKISNYIPHLHPKILQGGDSENRVQPVREVHQISESFPPGHFYSVIPNISEISQKEKKIFTLPPGLPGINLSFEKQKALFIKLTSYYASQPFHSTKQTHLRYYFENPNYAYGDGLLLYMMIRQVKPKRIIEIGSGYSSCVILDTNELFFKDKIRCSFIEPYPKLLMSLLKPRDLKRNIIIQKKIQDVPLSLFKSLEANDILFIDSTHVSKVGSDVHTILFSILPMLKPGVYIHFHDIFYPFEYPKEWIYKGIFWNENYILRAFLMNNNSYSISFFMTYYYFFNKKDIQRKASLILQNPGAGLWIRRK